MLFTYGDILMTIRNVIVSFRLTEDEASHLDQAGGSLAHTRSRGDFARASAMQEAGLRILAPAKAIRTPARRKPTADTEALTKILGQLGKIGSNINQLAKVAHQTGDIPSEATLLQMSEFVSVTCHSVSATLSGEKTPEELGDDN